MSNLKGFASNCSLHFADGALGDTGRFATLVLSTKEISVDENAKSQHDSEVRAICAR